jgi:hypothetical protein
MRLFIRLQDGQPFEHPIMEDNFRQAFPDLDIENLPPEFARFQRVEQPILGPYEVCEGCTYEWVNDIVQDVWNVRKMNEQERQNKIDVVMQQNPFPSWIFVEDLCLFEPPIPYPNDGKRYVWSEKISNWVEFQPE